MSGHPVRHDRLTKICERLGIVKPIDTGRIAENLYAVKTGPVNFFIMILYVGDTFTFRKGSAQPVSCLLNMDMKVDGKEKVV